jgi:hypothetical protein
LSLDTVPPGADCALTRNGMFVGRVNPTPGTVTVRPLETSSRAAWWAYSSMSPRAPTGNTTPQCA